MAATVTSRSPRRHFFVSDSVRMRLRSFHTVSERPFPTRVNHQIARTLAVAVFILSSLFVVAAVHAEDSEIDTRYQSANSKYDAGDFKAAAVIYETLVDDQAFSPDLFFNLGNARYRLGEPGGAALNYHRALVFDPAMAEARQNLTVIEDQTGALIIENHDLDAWIAKLSPGFFAVSSTLFLWMAILLVVIACCVRRSRPWLPALIIMSVLSLGLLAVSRYAEHVWENRLSSSNYAVVTAAGVSARVNAVPDAAEVIALPPGSVVRILEQRGPWRFVAIPGNLRGWLHADHASAVWPVSP